MNITRNEILERLRAEADRVITVVPCVRMFVFGSLIRTESWPSDVDVLVVYENTPDVACVRAILEPLYSEMPLHVLFLSKLRPSPCEGYPHCCH